VKIEDLTLSAVDVGKHAAVSEEVVTAVAFAAKMGYGPATCHRFVSALVVTNTLLDMIEWAAVLRKVRDLQLDEQIKELEAGRGIVGEVRE